MDVDGTLTDGKIYMGDNGEMFKAFDIKDGYAIKCLLPQHNIIPVIITGRCSKIVENRCQELSITECHQNTTNKMEALEEVLTRYSQKEHVNYTLSNVAFIGDDVLDMLCMEPVKQAGGLVGCPADAIKPICDMADFVSQKNGGDGAVREFVEWILEAKQ